MTRQISGHGHSTWSYGELVIDRKPGVVGGLPASRYCYELSYQEKKLKTFEYQKEAKYHVSEMVEAHCAIMKRRHKEERDFMKKYGLRSFPKSL